MKTFKKLLLILFLFLCLIYTSNLGAIPNNIVLFEGEELNIPTLFGIQISQTQNVSTTPIGVDKSSKNNNKKISNSSGTYNLAVSIANIKLKELQVEVVPKTSVVISGNTIGARLYTNGVLVVGMSEIDGNKPYKDSGIEEGDIIVEIDKQAIICTADLIEKVNRSNRK